MAAYELENLLSDTEESTFFLRKYLSEIGISEIEAEANRFAFQLLMYNFEPNECTTIYNILDYFHLPWNVLLI